tara:strand:+ start:4119 stop:4511 length:393 start_codon:yes stop_codon:yes gene_type:complete
MLSNILAKLVGQAGSIIDEVVTSKEEKLQLKNEIEKAILDHEIEIQKNVTERWKADSISDSWLSKNVRPMVLIFLVISTVLMIFIEAGVIAFEVKSNWIDLLQLVLITVIGAYFGGRSLEKVKNANEKIH